MLRAIHHKRIISLEELYEGENYIYLVTQVFRGRDLMQMIINKG